ncbi:MAG: RtcB family protein [Clostridiales bacterium]|jgi:tRNA-splicing ligase RtcB|nr:RtcB family protein [Clostridiales bacterium]
MFVISNNNTRLPIKIWLNDISEIESSCLEQAYNLSNLPFIHKWVSLMPDTHTGFGMPIGGVIATDGVIIPNAVGMDIGCGMAFISTDINISDIEDIQTGNGSFIQAVIGDILRNIPVGFNHYKEKQGSQTLDKANECLDMYIENKGLVEQIGNGYYQIGTLGGGNHFIELQVDESGNIGIMVHSGSRNFGLQICKYYNKIAKSHNEKWYSSVPGNYSLAFLPVDHRDGINYIKWMNLALDFAYENRSIILSKAKEILERYIAKYTNITFSYGQEINCHHNYASLEHHFNKNVWVHRKGATRARLGEIAAIPGAMGSYSYIVEGLGNEHSFYSSSHGAGRKYSRKGAMANFSTESVMLDLKEQNVAIGKHNKSDIAEESRFAYKDIDTVMASQKDLVKPIKKLKTIGVVKG